jgi:hypothetical protein
MTKGKLKDLINNTNLALTTFIAGRTLDHISTVDFVNRLGIIHEVNERAMWAYEAGGYFRGFLPLEIIQSGIIAFSALYLNHKLEKIKFPVKFPNFALYYLGSLSAMVGIQNYINSHNF